MNPMRLTSKLHDTFNNEFRRLEHSGQIAPALAAGDLCRYRDQVDQVCGFIKRAMHFYAANLNLCDISKYFSR